MRKKSWRSFCVWTFVFLVVWNFILPLSFKGKIQHCFFTAQVPMLKLCSGSQHFQESIALQGQSKQWWINKTRELISENAYLKLKLSETQDIVDLSKRVLEINKIDVGENFKCLPANVIYRSYEMWAQFLVIDKGARDGVCVGQGVICTGGVVGRISNVKDKVAFVELITSPNFRMLVHIEKDVTSYLFCGLTNKKGWRHVYKGQLLDMVASDILACPRRVETTHLGQQFPDHIYVGQLLEIKKKGSKYVGTVMVGDYVKWVREVGVLLPTLTL